MDKKQIFIFAGVAIAAYLLWQYMQSQAVVAAAPAVPAQPAAAPITATTTPHPAQPAAAPPVAASQVMALMAVANSHGFTGNSYDVDQWNYILKLGNPNAVVDDLSEVTGTQTRNAMTAQVYLQYRMQAGLGAGLSGLGNVHPFGHAYEGVGGGYVQ